MTAIASEKTRSLSTKQRRALEALLSGLSRDQTAAAAGVTTRTIDRWRAEDTDFQDELRERSLAAVGDAALRLRGTIDGAVDVLREVLEDKKARPAVRLRAAQVAIDAALRLVETTEVLERLEALERRYAGR